VFGIRRLEETGDNGGQIGTSDTQVISSGPVTEDWQNAYSPFHLGISDIYDTTELNREWGQVADDGSYAIGTYYNDQRLRTANYDSNDNLLSESGTNASGNTWSESLNGDASTFTYNGQQYRGTQLASSAGLTLGSSIGGILGGNSLAGHIGASTVLGTLGQSVGNILDRSGFTDALLGNGPFTTNLFDSAVSTTVANFGGDLGVNAVGTIAGTFSSLLFGEAAHALGLNGFAAGAFTTIGTSITSQLATNLGAMTLNALDIPTTLVADFSPGNFVGNAAGAIGGYFGSYLAAEIVPPRGPDAAIGGRIGGAVGSFLASQIPVIGQLVGPAIGSFIGTIVGTIIGGVFDIHYTPWDAQVVSAGPGGVLGITYVAANPAGHAFEFTDLSNLVAGQANQVLALTRSNPGVGDVTGLSGNGALQFQRYGATAIAFFPDATSSVFYVNGMPQATALQALFNVSQQSTLELVDHAVIAGGDPITTGALAAARVLDNSTPAVYSDLLIAQDYERYRANAEAINTLMAVNPDSDFTAGWDLTLLRAQALGLDRIVSQPGWTASLLDEDEVVYDAYGNVAEELVYHSDGSVTPYYRFISQTITSGTTQSVPNGASATIGSSTIVTAGISTNLTVAGDSNQINAGEHSSIDLYGSSNVIHASNGSARLENGSHSSITGANEGFVLLSNTSLIANGTGDSVDIYGTSNIVRAGNAGLTLEAGASAMLAGDADHALMTSNAALSVTGSGDSVEANGTGGSLVGDNLGISVDVNAGLAIQGSSNNITLAGGSSMSLNGSQNAIQVNGTAGLNITQGQQNTIASNSNYMIFGDQTATTLNGSSDTITLGNRASLILNGASDTVNASGTASISVQGGALVLRPPPVGYVDQANIINIDSGTVTIRAGSRVTVNGGGTVSVDFADYSSGQVTLSNNGGGNFTVATPDGNQDSLYGVQWIRFSDSQSAFFNFNFVDTTLSYGTDGHTYLTGPGGAVYDVTRAGHLYFNDGHIDEVDGTPLVDDLYYDAMNHDVYLAGLDPDAHYAQYWQTGRNPNAYFDTNYYLSQNPDVAAAGVNPLAQYDATGWREGRNPSMSFSTRDYLRAYPDVAAASMDPLLHFLQYGMAEGRRPWQFQAAPLNDFNGDGLSDLLWRNADGTFTEWQSNGNAFTTNVYVDSRIGPNWQIVASGDFNGDGRADILWRGIDGTFTEWQSNGNAFISNVYVDSNVTMTWQIVSSGDFNGDGRADILWRNGNDGMFTEWQSNGNGFNANVYRDSTVDPSWQVVSTGDFNGDHRADILWRNSTDGLFTEWQSNGNAFTTNVYRDWTVDPSWEVASTGDFNGDGRADILWRHTDGMFTEWQSNGAAFTTNVDVDVSVDASWQVAGSGDFNGDGRTDILWRHTDGMFTEWQSNGDSFTQNVYIDNTVSSAWALQPAH
jgi:hypothetical protein